MLSGEYPYLSSNIIPLVVKLRFKGNVYRFSESVLLKCKTSRERKLRDKNEGKVPPMKGGFLNKILTWNPFISAKRLQINVLTPMESKNEETKIILHLQIFFLSRIYSV